jgi:hypothetical protein
VLIRPLPAGLLPTLVPFGVTGDTRAGDRLHRLDGSVSLRDCETTTALVVNSPWKKCTGDKEVNRVTPALWLLSVIAFSHSLTFAQELPDGKRM